MTCLPCLPIGKYFIFEVKLTKWIAQVLKDAEISIVTYLDDFILASQDNEPLIRQAQSTLKLFSYLGWLPQKVKTFYNISWDLWLGIKPVKSIGLSQLK